ncbi:MAG: thioredoxin-disulfide reductase, partial [Chloroflexota bacterium]|nr:thioredoxin-disulfide reductase [Chloroflexota bacterium]
AHLGFINTSRTLGTSLEGVFAAGDSRGGNTKQVVSAVSQGATAALMTRNHLEKQQGNRGYKGD